MTMPDGEKVAVRQGCGEEEMSKVSIADAVNVHARPPGVIPKGPSFAL